MTRFLTPGKIGLLVLIELYTDAVVPSASMIPVLSFIISHLLPSSLPKAHNKTPGVAVKEKSGLLIVSIQDFKNLLAAHPSAVVPGRNLWDLFLEKLWKIESLDAIHQFFESRSDLLTKTKEQVLKETEAGLAQPTEATILLSRTSPFGVFVRRSQLEFTRLKFHDALVLWKSFIAYRHPTLPMWQRRNPDATSWSFDDVLSKGNDEWGPEVAENMSSVAYGNTLLATDNHEGFASTDDVEKLLEFQVDQMQKLGNRVPETVQDQFKGLINSNVMIPSLSHYVNFLDAWRAGDYPTSFDNLHRFFDYTMQNRDRLFYQYALLNLAVLQADFGCYQDAVAAMEETVATARENKDMGCLNFSLSWLYHFGKAHPNAINDANKTNMLGIEREGLAFLKVKAKESGMWSLWSSSLLTEAKMGLCNGESIATAFENVIRSSQLSITKNMMSNVGAQMMLQSSLWSRLGNAQIAWSYCEVFLRCHFKYAPFDDILKFTSRAAYLLAQKGKQDEAMARLEGLDVNSLRSLKVNQYWLRFRGILRLKRDLHRNNLNGADQLLSQLLSSQGGDSDLAFELHSLEINALTRRGDLSGALARIEELNVELRERGDDIYYQAKLLIMKAVLLDKCGRPQRGFSISVRAANIAWRARLLPLLWHSMGVIANILNSLSEFEASQQILTAVMPRVLELEDCAVAAQLFSFLVDAHMGLAGQAKDDESKRTENLTKALQFIDRSFAEYSALEDVNGECEMMAKKATIVRYMGDHTLAEDYAARYLALKKEAAEFHT